MLALEQPAHVDRFSFDSRLLQPSGSLQPVSLSQCMQKLPHLSAEGSPPGMPWEGFCRIAGKAS